MRYEIITTDVFKRWFNRIKNKSDKARIIVRIDRISLGNFGDYKKIGEDLFELRFFFSTTPYRIYFTVKEGKIVILLCGGDKKSKKAQNNDVIKAKEIMKALKEDDNG